MYFTTKHTKNTKGKNKIIKKLFVTFLCCPLILKALGLPDPESRYPLLEQYVDLLLFWNRRVNLIGSGDTDVWERHILDSLSGYNIITGNKPAAVADLGTGAGLPGIPLAVFMPETVFYLSERSGKKTGFLRNCVPELGLENVEILEGPFENIRKPFDIAVFRAFSPLDPDFIGTLKKVCGSDTVFLAYKGRTESIKKELSFVGKLVRDVKILPLTVPGLREERNMIIFRV